MAWINSFFLIWIHCCNVFTIKRTGHGIPGYLPIPGRHFSANTRISPYCLVYDEQTCMNAVYRLAKAVFPMGKYPPIPWPVLRKSALLKCKNKFMRSLKGFPWSIPKAFHAATPWEGILLINFFFARVLEDILPLQNALCLSFRAINVMKWAINL